MRAVLESLSLMGVKCTSTCLVMRAVLESLSLIGVKCITYLFSNEGCLRVSIFDGCEMYHLPV